MARTKRFRKSAKEQGIIPTEEWATFLETLKSPLPVTFRITGSRSHAHELRKILETEYIPRLKDIVIDGEPVEPPKHLPWYPEGLGWHFTASRSQLRKSPELSKFHKFLVSETDVGNISRQEAVSMLPPLLLDVQPHHWVMDMCAAPGSKTAQLLEAIHANDQEGTIPSGLVLANDADHKRSYMLIHQTKRLQSPCLVVTNHDGTFFPNINLASADGKPNTMQFDRILCDVPCSGDGTFRKNELLWKTWNHNNAVALHSTQVKILLRGCCLLKVGGRIVYSTCSLNPLENEAVIAEVLNRCKGAVELVDVSEQLPGLIRRPGVSDWKVINKDNVHIKSVEEVPKEDKRRYLASHFPPENAASLGLEKCVRVYPHLQNTGGFFVAVFKKTSPLTAVDRAAEDRISESAEATPAPDAVDAEGEESIPQKRAHEETQEDGSNEEEAEAKRAKTEDVDPTKEASEDEAKPVEVDLKSKNEGRINENPFIIMESNSEDIGMFCDYYGISEKFPRDSYLVRSEGNKNKTIYFISESVKKILEAPDNNRLRVVNTGVKVFIRNVTKEGVFPFRIHSEGLTMMFPFLSETRVIDITSNDIKILMEQQNPKFEHFSEGPQQRLKEVQSGCYICRYDPKKEGTSSILNTVLFPVWRANVSVNILLNKKEQE
ncbi:S-adenosyl-L-methionine-dependent methyltransferase [Basidiobolus meristosporus CBS 931.73]|uniref:S-adenosyl-L-methionine-dependent methyltransferase n=1 Tax=Basidiobolus meristosporus CBS 931.73 TaxID=1314790 RepID=A0A1Y1YM30_9FUNG|nr:S-adenosyl-L-methionine-dependent methyltransferase [Basidiobolus meristosporus CBS 931.73]|eukprot:ORX99070.1 S-adenosyl-L-methionine-dependent methyltransferase [Basidiobolus meristosporus CBS 931.73]